MLGVCNLTQFDRKHGLALGQWAAQFLDEPIKLSAGCGNDGAVSSKRRFFARVIVLQLWGNRSADDEDLQNGPSAPSPLIPLPPDGRGWRGVLKIAVRVVELRNGRVSVEGPVEALKSEAKLKEVYL